VALSPLDSGPRRLADSAHGAIMAAMLDGRLQPGDRLVMDKLAAELGISRTPVRDALQRLENEGVIVASPPRGYEVRLVSADEIRAIYQAREAVEGYAAREFVALARGAIKEVEAAIDEAELFDLSSATGAFDANRLIHRSIVAAHHNSYLLDLFDDIWGKAAAVLTFAELFGHEDEHPDIRSEHVVLLRALRSGDSAKAEKAAITHIRQGLKRNLPR
jgi:DNA-binding GntR family transcriptional regulator